jgi:carboxyl-terminal processing protease
LNENIRPMAFTELPNHRIQEKYTMRGRITILSLLLSFISTAALAAPKLVIQPKTSFDLHIEDTPKELVDEVWQTVNRQFVDNTFNKQDWIAMRSSLLAKDYKSKTEAYEAIRNALKVLNDPYTRFLEPKEFQSLREETTGELVGVGIQLGNVDSIKSPVIRTVIDDSPAIKAGLMPKDELVAVDGKSTANLKIPEVSKMIRGDKDTKVTLTVMRSGQKLDFVLVRAPIELQVVNYALKEENGQKIGYIRLQEFSDKAPKEMRKAIASLNNQGVKGWVLDLRSNPGGVLDAATRIASLLLPEGTIVSTVDRQGTKEQVPADRHPQTTLPLVVLVDGGSASATEILAGALQDNRRAMLVGTKTFGKGVIQQVNPLSDGSGVNVTIAHYLTPSGNDIHKKGIIPDVIVPFPEDLGKTFTAEQIATSKDPQYQRAATLLSSQIRATTIK